MKHILLVYHSRSGSTRSLADAVIRGVQQEPEVELRVKTASEAVLADLVWADALLIGSPENFGNMAGLIKDFFDRTFYPAQQYPNHQSYALFVSAGNDGTGAVREIDRILLGYPMHKALEPVIIKGEVTADALQQCEDLGLSLAAGLSLGMF